MNSLFLAATNQDAMASVAAIGGFIWVICALIGLIYILCPLLYLFSFSRLENQGKKHLEYQAVLLKEVRAFNKLQQELLAQSTLAAFEAQQQNYLSRQLLRAYGHEPEV
jgi:beta-lactamase regulating signal transducer with metallopeptidase domain